MHLQPSLSSCLMSPGSLWNFAQMTKENMRQDLGVEKWGDLQYITTNSHHVFLRDFPRERAINYSHKLQSKTPPMILMCSTSSAQGVRGSSGTVTNPRRVCSSFVVKPYSAR